MQIHPTALVDPSAQLAEDVVVGAYAFIGPEVTIGPGTRIAHHANIYKQTKIGRDCVLWPFVSLGTDPQDLKYKGESTTLEIGDRVTIREFATVNRGTGEGGGVTRVGDGCLLMAYSHVAHDCQLGRRVVMANSTNLAGHVIIEDFVGVGGLVAVHQFTRLGTHCFIGGMSGVSQDMPPYCLCEGNHAKTHGLNTIGLRRAGVPESSIAALKKAYRLIFRTRTPIKKVLAEVREQVEQTPEVAHLVEFIETSERGVPR